MNAWPAALYSFLAHDLIVIAVVPFVLLRRQNPAVTIAWIFAILLMPFVGAVAYLIFGNSRIARRAHARGRHRLKHRVRAPAEFANIASPIDVRGQLQLFRLLERINTCPAVAGNKVCIYTDMAENYAHQLDAIRGARHHVHIEYYIFQPDAIGERFRDELIAAARRGVEVRFLYDSLGSLYLHGSWLREMQQAGIETAGFIPLNPLTRRWIFNFRNHRKIVVVDGTLAFMGGANIGKEYLGEGDIKDWADTHLRIEGPAVRQLQRVFAEDWAFAGGKVLTSEEHFPELEPRGSVVAQVVPGGPDARVPVYHQLYFSAVANAVQQVRITTPYFVPSESVLTAIETAALRGVDVEILLPGISTKFFVQTASRAYYEELLDAGVKIYEFQPGFMHSKYITVDGRWSVVGTANFDNRSMRLNFEIGLALYDAELTIQLDRTFDENRARSLRIDRDQWRRRPAARRIFENSVSLFSPIL